MPDMEKLRIQGTLYTIRDQTAREAAAAADEKADTAIQNAQTADNKAASAITMLNRAKMANRKIILLGDSYNAGWTPEGTVQGWGERAIGILGKTVGTNAWNVSYGGAGFSFADNNPMSFYYQLNALINTLTAAQKAEITDVVIGGGRNDNLAANSAINAGITSCCNLVRSQLPNAQGWIFAMGWDGDAEVRRALVTRYYEAYSRTGAYYGWRYRALYQMLQDRSYMSASDRKHPTNDGNYLLGISVAALLSGSDLEEGTIELPVYITGGAVAGFGQRNGNMVTLFFPGAAFTPANDLTAGQFVDTGAEINCRYIFGCSLNDEISIRLSAVLRSSGGLYETSLLVKFVPIAGGNHKIYALQQAPNQNHTGWLDGSTIDQVTIRKQIINIPVEYA